MPTFTPVDHDPFASDAPAPSAPSSASAISFSDGSSGGGPVFVPVDHDPFADGSSPAPVDDAGGARVLTIHGGRQTPPPPAPADAAPARPPLGSPITGSVAALSSGFAPSGGAPAASPAAAGAAASAKPPGFIPYEDAITPPTPHPGGVLSNSWDDGYLSGAAKGGATAAIKGVGDLVGAVGGLSGLADYLIARGESAITGKPVDQVQAEHAATRQRVQADMSQDWLGRLAVATDPTNVLPAPADVSGAILAKTGEYVPTSEPGKIAQAGVEAAVGAFGPGGGAISPGTAGRAVASTLARQAPAMAVAGGVGQGVTDATGDPLLGLGAGLVGVPLAEAAGSKTAGAMAPVVGGSKMLNAAPVIGPAIDRARGNEVARTILGTADDPAAVRAAVAQPVPDSGVPGSPQTFAGQIGTDQGLLESEKALRNTKAEKLSDGSAPTYFNAVDRGQSAAQVAALQGVQPTGDVFAPGALIRSRMDAIDAAASDAVDRLTAAHADAVAGRASSGQAFADQQRSDLAARQADRIQAGSDFAGQQRADLADRTIARGQASGEDKAAGDAARQATHDALVQRLADALATQRGTAETAAEPLAGGTVNANDLGSTLRGAVEQVRAGQKDVHRQLYRAVDPNGSLAMVATPIGDRASGIASDLAAKGGELSPAEAPLFRRAAALPDVAGYGMVHQLDTDISAAMSAERRSAGETPTLARLTQLKGAVKDAMNGAADNQSAWEQRQVAAGRMAPEDTMAARINGLADEWNGAAQQPQARSRTGTGDTTYPSDGAAVVPQSYRAEGQGGGGYGASARDQGLSGYGGRGPAPIEVGNGPRPDAPAYDPDGMRVPQRPSSLRPQDLQAFIREHGGIRDTGGELAAMGLHDLVAKGKVGLGADRMRLLAAEAGYLGGDTAAAMRETHPNDLLDALSGDRPVYSVHDEDAAAEWAAYDDAKERHDSARGEFGTRSKFGVMPERRALDAYTRDDIEGPNGPQARDPATSGLLPNFDKAAENRLRAANAAYAEYAKTYKNPIVGPGLKTTGYAGQYARTDSSFVRAAIKAGPDGYEQARAFLTAAKGDPEALAAMKDAALNPLRKAVTGNGTLPPAAFTRWKSADGYGPALRALDEASPGFSARFDKASDATQALLDLGAAHNAQLGMAQAEAARQAILDNLQRREELKQATAADRATVSSLLAERAANDKAAGQADRAGVASSLADRRAADSAAIAQSRADTSAGISVARSIVADAKATPAAQYLGKAGNAVATTEVENTVGGFLKTGTGGASRMRGLVQSVASDPDALAGLRKAGAGWMSRTFTDDGTGLLSGAKFIGFLKDNADTLRELYPHDQLSMLGAIARDAEANARWRTSTAIGGGSDSVKNLLASLDKVGGGHGGHVTLGMVAIEAISKGLEHAGVKGAVYAGTAAAGAYLVNTLRSAGIKRTANLYREAMANPELARALISKMPTTADGNALHNLARVLKRGLIVGPMMTRQGGGGSK